MADVTTTRKQRIGIWIIAVVLTIGTIGSFAVLVLADKNQAIDQTHIQKLLAEYQKAYAAYENKKATQPTDLSNQYYSEFNTYQSQVGQFDKNGVDSLKTSDLKVGDGNTIDMSKGATVYYTGWRPDGTVIDSSISGGKLSAPLNAVSSSVIAGWTEGMKGMKVGGVRLLTIPSNKAYGSSGSGDKIPANTPLKFVIMVIPTPATIAEPQPDKEILQYYTNNGASAY